MLLFLRAIFTILLFICLTACHQKNEKAISVKPGTKNKVKDTVANPNTTTRETKKEEPFKLDEDNAIPFFFDYAQQTSEKRVKITTQFGSFVIELFEETPYHRANFIYLTKSGYFNTTYFHRVVKGFIIQGGNSDNRKTGEKRASIGRYLLPPDTKKGFKHHRGVVSMPSSDIDNPHKLASPFEFFIVVKDPGSYHLDGNYTAFGRVIQGMDVVDTINALPTDDGEWPLQNVYIKAEVTE
ncbi:peptidylprolyl isomerase [Ascidiimonas aurantiaca]|uniref:peptidylprolyl isomerase n=1 Tax=Ascidiimonas aurantiaca TaxID=1685432 RepID=UPI0030EC9C6F